MQTHPALEPHQVQKQKQKIQNIEQSQFRKAMQQKYEEITKNPIESSHDSVHEPSSTWLLEPRRVHT